MKDLNSKAKCICKKTQIQLQHHNIMLNDPLTTDINSTFFTSTSERAKQSLFNCPTIPGEARCPRETFADCYNRTHRLLARSGKLIEVNKQLRHIILEMTVLIQKFYLQNDVQNIRFPYPHITVYYLFSANAFS